MVIGGVVVAAAEAFAVASIAPSRLIYQIRGSEGNGGGIRGKTIESGEEILADGFDKACCVTRRTSGRTLVRRSRELRECKKGKKNIATYLRCAYNTRFILTAP